MVAAVAARFNTDEFWRGSRRSSRYQVSQAEDYRPAEPLRTRASKRIAFEGAVNVSVAVKEAPGASQRGAPVDRINGLPAGKAHDVAPVELVRGAPDVRLSPAISNCAPMGGGDGKFTGILPAAPSGLSRSGPHNAAAHIGAIRRNAGATGHPWFCRTHGGRSRDEAVVYEVIGSEDIPSIPDVKNAVILAAPKCRSECLRAVLLAATVPRLKPL